MQTVRAIFCLALVFTGALPAGNCVAGILYPQAPAGGEQIVYNELKQFLDTDTPCLSEPGLHIDDIKMAAPYGVYNVSVQDVASGSLLAAARFSGSWMYSIMHATNEVGTVSLRDKNAGKLEFDSLYETYGTRGILDALRIAEQLPSVQKDDYEVRWLSCGAVPFDALWLHGKADDILIPLPEAYGKWRYKPYSESEMLHSLKPKAEKIIKDQGLAEM